MPKPEATTVLVKCRFCEKDIWAQSDNGEPECEDCATLAGDACRDLYEVELTLQPLTEWERGEV
jgi:hypothetical protein